MQLDLQVLPTQVIPSFVNENLYKSSDHKQDVQYPKDLFFLQLVLTIIHFSVHYTTMVGHILSTDFELSHYVYHILRVICAIPSQT